MKTLFRWFVQGAGWELGKEAAQAAVNEAREQLEGEVDERTRARDAARREKAEAKRRRAEAKARAREAREAEAQLERELRELKKKL